MRAVHSLSKGSPTQLRRASWDKSAASFNRHVTSSMSILSVIHRFTASYNTLHFNLFSDNMLFKSGDIIPEYPVPPVNDANNSTIMLPGQTMPIGGIVMAFEFVTTGPGHLTIKVRQRQFVT